MKRFALATLVTTLFLMPSCAHAYRGGNYGRGYGYGHGHHNNGAALALGIAGGIVGAVVVDRLLFPPVVYAYPTYETPRVYYAPAPAYVPYPAYRYRDPYRAGYRRAYRHNGNCGSSNRGYYRDDESYR